jgi:hypothetical protein
MVMPADANSTRTPASIVVQNFTEHSSGACRIPNHNVLVEVPASLHRIHS